MNLSLHEKCALVGGGSEGIGLAVTKTGRLNALIKKRAKAAHTTAEQIIESMTGEIPAQRFAEPEEIAAVAAFLASPAAAYVNGTSIPVDGGKIGAI